HRLEPLRRMTGPVDELTDDAQGLTATERQGRIPGELLVGQVRVVLEVPGGLDDVDASAALAGGELCAPDRRVERPGEVDVVHRAARLEVRLAPRDEQLPHRKVCLRAVQVHARLVRLERNGLARGAHRAMLASTEAAARRRRGLRAAVLLEPDDPPRLTPEVASSNPVAPAPIVGPRGDGASVRRW